MRVLVTGGSGNVGHHVIDELYRRGHSVVNADVVRTGAGARAAAFAGMRQSWPANPQFFEVDVTDYGQVISAMDGCDAVIALAARPSNANYTEEDVLRTNVTWRNIRCALTIYRRCSTLPMSTKRLIVSPFHPNRPMVLFWKETSNSQRVASSISTDRPERSYYLMLPRCIPPPSVPPYANARPCKHTTAIDTAGVVSQVGFMSRYYPSSEKVVELLEKRQPRHAQILKFYSGKHIRYWTSRYELCGGSFVENTIHTVDLLRYFLGDIDKVSAFYFERGSDDGPEPINMPYVYGVNYRFASGVVGNATTSRVLTNVKASRGEVLIISDDSLIEWSTDEVVENGESVWKAADGARRSAFAYQAKAFIYAVRAEDPTLVRSPYGPSLNSLAAVLGANASAEDGGNVIDLQDFASAR